MIQELIKLLKIAKERKLSGHYIEIALGKYKFPETLKEGYEMFKKELWLRK